MHTRWLSFDIGVRNFAWVLIESVNQRLHVAAFGHMDLIKAHLHRGTPPAEHASLTLEPCKKSASSISHIEEQCIQYVQECIMPYIPSARDALLHVVIELQMHKQYVVLASILYWHFKLYVHTTHIPTCAVRISPKYKCDAVPKEWITDTKRWSALKALTASHATNKKMAIFLMEMVVDRCYLGNESFESLFAPGSREADTDHLADAFLQALYVILFLKPVSSKAPPTASPAFVLHHRFPLREKHLPRSDTDDADDCTLLDTTIFSAQGTKKEPI